MSQEAYRSYLQSMVFGGVKMFVDAPSLLGAPYTQAGGVYHNGFVYVLGGFNATVRSDVSNIFSVNKADIGTPATTTVLGRALNSVRTSCLVHKGKVYVFGGNYLNLTPEPDESTSSAKIYYGDPDDVTGLISSWTDSATPFAQGREQVAVVSVGDDIYVAGGVHNDGSIETPKDTVYYVTPVTNGSFPAVNAVQIMPEERYDGALVSYLGYLYYIGGTSDGDPYLTSIISAKINADKSLGTWSEVSNLPRLSKSFNAFVYNGWLYILGGTDLGYATISYAKLLKNGEIDENSWVDNSVPFPAGYNLGSFAVDTTNGWLYLAGGGEGGTVGVNDKIKGAKLITPPYSG